MNPPFSDIADLRERLASCGDYEQKLDRLRIYTRERQRAIRDADLSGAISLTQLFEALSDLAEAVLTGSLEVAWEALGGSILPERPRGDFAVIAMGKFGGRELTYRSDLDIIYLYEDPQDQEIYGRLGTRIISAISLLTREGSAYAVDTALRPSGNRGTLVSSLASFEDYHRTTGRTWERQALIRARTLPGALVSARGDDRFAGRVRETIAAIAYQKCDPEKTAEEIDQLRGRMEREIARETPGRYNLKTGRGGLVDVEFAVQYLQLVHGHDRPNVRNFNTISALRALSREGILPPSLAQPLEEGYLFLRHVETRLRLVLDQPADDLRENGEALRELEARFFPEGRVIERVKSAREAIRAVYERVMRS